MKSCYRKKWFRAQETEGAILGERRVCRIFEGRWSGKLDVVEQGRKLIREIE